MNLTHYHGTGTTFDRFDPAHLGQHHHAHAGGFWMTSSFNVARAFALSAHPKPTIEVTLPDLAEIPRWRDRFQIVRDVVRQEWLYGTVYGMVGVPMVPGRHWDGAVVLRCEIDGPVYVCGDDRVSAPGIAGAGLLGRYDPEVFPRAIAEAKAAGAVAVHFPSLLEGVGANLTFAPTTLVLDPAAIRIVERIQALSTLEKGDHEAAEEALDFWTSEYLPETETHIAGPDGKPWHKDENGDRWTLCGTEWSERQAIVDEEPTCELCAIEWRYRDDPAGYAGAIERYFDGLGMEEAA